MCETMQSSHRLRPAMSLVHALLAPTASGDGAGERFCAPLPPSPHFSGTSQEGLDEFHFFSLGKFVIFALLGGDRKSKALGSHGWSRVGTSKIIS